MWFFLVVVLVVSPCFSMGTNGRQPCLRQRSLLHLLTQVFFLDWSISSPPHEPRD